LPDNEFHEILLTKERFNRIYIKQLAPDAKPAAEIRGGFAESAGPADNRLKFYFV